MYRPLRAVAVGGGLLALFATTSLSASAATTHPAHQHMKVATRGGQVTAADYAKRAVTASSRKHAAHGRAPALQVQAVKRTGAPVAGLAMAGPAARAVAAAAASPAMDPGGRPDYFGQAPNHANSQLPTGGASVSIADVTGTAATASATVEKGPVVGVTVDNGGRGYTGSPTISFGGNGAGAKAHAVVVGGVTGVVVTAGGSNYSSGAPPAVTFSAPTSAAGTLAKGTVLIDQTGAVPGIQIDDAGSGYVAGKVTATITDASAPAGQGATVTASVSGTIESIVADGGGGGYAPEANELGRKDAVLMHPLEDTIVALRPQAPTLPPKIPNSVRSIDPTVPANANIATFDPKTGQTITVKNAVVDYGWEYVWHCHMLSHEELDFMGR